MRFSRVSTDDGIGFSGQALRGTCQRSGKSRFAASRGAQASNGAIGVVTAGRARCAVRRLGRHRRTSTSARHRRTAAAVAARYRARSPGAARDLVDQTHRGRDACAVHWGLLPTFACGVSESRRHCVAAFPRACVARPPTPIVLRAPRGRCRARVPRRRRAACRTGREQLRDHTRGYRRLGESVPQRVVDVVMP